MRVNIAQWNATLAAAMLLAALQAGAQSIDSAAPPPPDDGTQSVQSADDSQQNQIPPQQLDQILAPIALYPDTLLAQVLMAATYPLEVVQADRWLRDPNHAALTGPQLDDALAQQPWDPSVKSLVPFPQVLRMMDNNLTWTEQLGDAFLAGQDAVMDSVQRLRQKAQAAGKLQSTPEQVVSTQGADIVVQPADAETVYVPVYDPDFAYGDWAYPDYPPDYFPGAFAGVVVGDLGFGWFGIGINAPLWGWNHWDWGHHRIDVDGNRFNNINAHRPPVASGAWHHDPSHRGGVSYRNAALNARFRGAAATSGARRDLRGYPVPAAAQSRIGADFNNSGNRNLTIPSRASANRAIRNNPPSNAAVPQLSHALSSETAPATRQSRLPANVVVAPSQFAGERERETRVQTTRQQTRYTQTFRAPAPAPAFESFGRGVDIRPQAQRGRESFQTMQQSAPAIRAAPAVRMAPVQAAPAQAAPAARGGGGGGRSGERR